MRRFAAIGLLVLHIGLFTEAPELLRFPILIEHFLEHRAQVPEMSFLQFMSMHYKTDVNHDSTDHELPFKDCCRIVTNAMFTTLADLNFNLEKPLPVDSQQFFPRYPSFMPSAGLSEIFQPPRI